MATYSTAWAGIIPTRPRPVFTDSKAKKTAAAAGLVWSQVKKQKQGCASKSAASAIPRNRKPSIPKGNAETWGTQTDAAMVNGTFQDLSVARGLTVSDLLDRYCEEQVLDSSQGSRIKLLQKELGRITLDQLRRAHCLDYVNKRCGTKVEQLKHYEQWLARQVASGAEEPDDAAELLMDARSGGMELPPIVCDVTLGRDFDVLGSAIAWAIAHPHRSLHPQVYGLL